MYADLHLNMTNLSTVLKRKGRSRLYHIENDFAMTVTVQPNGIWAIVSNCIWVFCVRAALF